MALRLILPAAAHPSLAFCLQPVPPMQKFTDMSNFDWQSIISIFLKLVKKIVVVLFELF